MMQYLKILLLSAVTFLLVSCKEQIAVVGEAAPEIAAFDLQGNQVQLNHWKGKKILLTFWSETCGACVAELKMLSQWDKEYPNKVQIVAINVDGDNADTLKAVEKHQLEMPVLKDQMKITAERYMLLGTPTAFVIDQTGKILYKFEGVIPKENLKTVFN